MKKLGLLLVSLNCLSAAFGQVVTVISEPPRIKFNAAALAKSAEAYYKKRGILLKYDTCTQILLLAQAQLDEVAIVAAEFKQAEDYSVWIWFDGEGNIAFRNKSIVHNGEIIPGSPRAYEVNLRTEPKHAEDQRAKD